MLDVVPGILQRSSIYFFFSFIVNWRICTYLIFIINYYPYCYSSCPIFNQQGLFRFWSHFEISSFYYFTCFLVWQDIPDLSFPLLAPDFVSVELRFHLLRNVLGDYNLIIRGWTLFWGRVVLYLDCHVLLTSWTILTGWTIQN